MSASNKLRYTKNNMDSSDLFHLFVSRELKHGIPITDENDNRLGESTKAAQQAISQVVVSRILMAAPGMGMRIAPFFGNWWQHLVTKGEKNTQCTRIFIVLLKNALMYFICLCSHPTISNEPFGEEGLFEGRHTV